MFKKIYVEITNMCNLKCSFCPQHKRENKYLSIENFKKILNKLEGYTKYLYFHIMGEPLMHPYINKLIDIASKKFKINITTNGYLIRKIENNKNIRQLNISLHSFNEKNGKSLDKYMQDIFEVTDKLRHNTIINYRLWTNFKDKTLIVNKLRSKYMAEITNYQIKLDENVFLDFEEEFKWPSLDNEVFNSIGTCLGTRTHIGILVDGTVVPCCLDNNGIINLGNVYKQNLNDIISSKQFLDIRNGFLNNNKICELCRKCSFYKTKGD